MNSVLELLIEAKALIEDESKWTKGYYARDVEGRYLEPTEDGAVCFCSLGALMRVIDGCTYPKSLKLDRAERLLNSCVDGPFDIVAYNDRPNSTHKGVMAVWDKAIQMERDWT